MALVHHLALGEHPGARGGDGLSRAESARIAAAVSGNRRRPGSGRHRKGLLRWTRAPEPTARPSSATPTPRPLPPSARALLLDGLRLIRRPASLAEESLLPLRRAGLSDRDHQDAGAAASYDCFGERPAGGPGPEFEPSLGGASGDESRAAPGESAASPASARASSS